MVQQNSIGIKKQIIAKPTKKSGTNRVQLEDQDSLIRNRMHCSVQG